MILKKGRWVTSYSQLEKYQKCPHQWETQYLIKPKIERLKSKHLEYGLSIHEILETFFTFLKQGETISREVMITMLNCRFDNRGIPFDSVEERLEYYDKACQMISMLYKPKSSFQRLLLECEIVGIEMDFELEIKLDEPYKRLVPDFITGEGEIEEEVDTIYVIGFIDLVLRHPEGYLIVIDHKSGNKKFDKKKLENDLQFPIYALAIKQDLKELPKEYYYNFTKLHIDQKVLINQERLDKAKAEINILLKSMFCKKKHTPKPTPLCFWCDFSKHKANICKRSSDFKPKPK